MAAAEAAPDRRITALPIRATSDEVDLDRLLALDEHRPAVPSI
jgi:hypothetical protein